MKEQVIQARQDIADLKQSIKGAVEADDVESFETLFREFKTPEIQQRWNFATRGHTQKIEKQDEFIDRMLLLTIQKDAGDILKVFHAQGVKLETILTPEHHDPIQHNLIQMAAQIDAVECIQAWYDLDFNIDLVCDIDDFPALMWAVPCQNINAFRKLLELGADPNRTAYHTRTVLDGIFTEFSGYDKKIQRTLSEKTRDQLLSNATENACQMIDLLNQHGYNFERKHESTRGKKDLKNIVEIMRERVIPQVLKPYWGKLLSHTEQIILDKKVVAFAPRSNVREP